MQPPGSKGLTSRRSQQSALTSAEVHRVGQHVVMIIATERSATTWLKDMLKDPPAVLRKLQRGQTRKEYFPLRKVDNADERYAPQCLATRSSPTSPIRALATCPPSRVGQQAAVGIAAERSVTTRLKRTHHVQIVGVLREHHGLREPGAGWAQCELLENVTPPGPSAGAGWAQCELLENVTPPGPRARTFGGRSFRLRACSARSRPIVSRIRRAACPRAGWGQHAAIGMATERSAATRPKTDVEARPLDKLRLAELVPAQAPPEVLVPPSLEGREELPARPCPQPL